MTERITYLDDNGTVVPKENATRARIVPGTHDNLCYLGIIFLTGNF